MRGIWRGRRTVEPPIGKRPRRTSKSPNTAPAPAMRMSVPWRISVPPATQGPSTAAMTGLRGRWWRSIAFQWRSGSAVIRSRYSSPSMPSPASALRSMPAQNAPPAPVRTTERTVSSASAASHPSYRPTSIGSDSAFFACGLFNMRTSVAPSRRTVRCSVPPMTDSCLRRGTGCRRRGHSSIVF
ncbi:hypothetical protein SCALM49S_08238 [Streptomyces californicus]